MSRRFKNPITTPTPRQERPTNVVVQLIERKIYIIRIRGEKVMLDSDLAVLYQVETFNLNKAVKRNRDRFPQDSYFSSPKKRRGL